MSHKDLLTLKREKNMKQKTRKQELQQSLAVYSFNDVKNAILRDTLSKFKKVVKKRIDKNIENDPEFNYCAIEFMNAFVDARKDVYTNPKNKWYEDCLIVQEVEWVRTKMFEDTKESAREIFELVEKYSHSYQEIMRVIHRFQHDYKYRNDHTRNERKKLKEELKELETS